MEKETFWHHKRHLLSPYKPSPVPLELLFYRKLLAIHQPLIPVYLPVMKYLQTLSKGSSSRHHPLLFADDNLSEPFPKPSLERQRCWSQISGPCLRGVALLILIHYCHMFLGSFALSVCIQFAIRQHIYTSPVDRYTR